MKTSLDSLEEDYWQLFTAFATGDRNVFKNKFREHAYNIAMLTRSNTPIEPDQQVDIIQPPTEMIPNGP